MPIKDIKDKILENAFQEKDKIIEEAKKEVEKIKEEAKNEIEKIKNNILQDYKQEADIKENKIITEAKLNANKDILSEKQLILEEIFLEAERRIQKLDNQRYKKFIENLIFENIELGNETIYISEKDQKIIDNAFIENINKKLISNHKKGKLKLSEKSISIRGGVVLGTEDIKKNASLEIMLERTKEDIETKLNKFLFLENEE
ncbi:MAG: V-type ATP synthase subunit E [Atribacterota bacterium]|nr:V-type ATP synthase subunit E [Atribacterota bacterium]MDD3030998.1 V-type ATP synthase subunit E [Atribacterota bacterium]MDD3640754.1 V-type ATP synthase subunit E [Atribacterota bacterium]MDD4764260.1 V-type ATP synthase subunit E [Atribacterota bacterium]